MADRDDKLRKLGYTVKKKKGARIILGGPALVAFASGETAAAFDPAKHPRHPRGVREGGRFRTYAAGDVEKLGPTPVYVEEPLEPAAIDPEIQALWQTDQPKSALKQMVSERLGERLAGDPDFQKLGQDLGPLVDTPIPSGSSPEAWMAQPYEQRVSAHLIEKWSTTSADHDPVALAMQSAASEEFGLSGVDDHVQFLRAYANPWPPFSEQGQAGARKFLRAQYDLTQEMFAERGITEVRYRLPGHRAARQPEAARRAARLGADGVEVEYRSNPLSSWSTSSANAKLFANGMSEDFAAHRSTLIGTRVPVARIVGSPLTGYGGTEEQEFVILGGVEKGVAWTYQGDGPATSEIEERVAAMTVIDLDLDPTSADWTKAWWSGTCRSRTARNSTCGWRSAACPPTSSSRCPASTSSPRVLWMQEWAYEQGWTAAGYVEAQHPRYPKGHPHGGRWMSKADALIAEAENQKAAETQPDVITPSVKLVDQTEGTIAMVKDDIGLTEEVQDALIRGARGAGQIREGLEQIGAVHGSRRPGTGAGDHAADRRGAGHAGISRAGITADMKMHSGIIQVTPAQDPDTVIGATVHESGHYMDVQLGRDAGYVGAFSETEAGEGWRIAAYSSTSVQMVQGMKRTAEIRLMDDPADLSAGAANDYLGYALHPKEVWARSYHSGSAPATLTASGDSGHARA